MCSLISLAIECVLLLECVLTHTARAEAAAAGCISEAAAAEAAAKGIECVLLL